MNAKDLAIHYGNATSLAPVQKLADQLAANLNDTETEAGSEAFIGSLMYYNNVRQADKNRIASARTYYEDLKKRFLGKPRKQQPDSPTA